MVIIIQRPPRRVALERHNPSAGRGQEQGDWQPMCQAGCLCSRGGGSLSKSNSACLWLQGGGKRANESTSQHETHSLVLPFKILCEHTPLHSQPVLRAIHFLKTTSSSYVPRPIFPSAHPRAFPFRGPARSSKPSSIPQRPPLLLTPHPRPPEGFRRRHSTYMP